MEGLASDLNEGCIIAQERYKLSVSGLLFGEPRIGYKELLVEVIKASTDGWNDRNLRSGRDATRKSTCKLNILLPDKNIYVLSNLSLLGGNPISKARVDHPKRCQRIRQRGGPVVDLDCPASAGKFTLS